MLAQNTAAAQHGYQNIKVNQDRNPWPKTGIASAVNPAHPRAWVVMSNDFRVNVNRIFYHVSTDAGKPGRTMPWSEELILSSVPYRSPFS